MMSPSKSESPSLHSADESKEKSPVHKSCESVYSNTFSSRGSASQIYQRKLPSQRVNNGCNDRNCQRQSKMVPVSDIRQRVISARKLRAKTFQNQLADAQHEIATLAHENRILRSMYKRQDLALSKYESSNAELPQLLHSHAEELRVWQTKFRNVQSINKDLEHKLKQKDGIILTLSDQNKHYSQLNKDKNLDERQSLQERVHALEQLLQEKDNDLKLMARKIQLEAKNSKQQLLAEQKKTKEVLLKLERSKLEISGYRKLDEITLGDKSSNLMGHRRSRLNLVEPDPVNLEKLQKCIDGLEKKIDKNKDLDISFSEGSVTHSAQSSARSNLETKIRNRPKVTLPPASASAKSAMKSPTKPNNKILKMPAMKMTSSVISMSTSVAVMQKATEHAEGGDTKYVAELKNIKYTPNASNLISNPESTSEYDGDYDNGIDEDDDGADQSDSNELRKNNYMTYEPYTNTDYTESVDGEEQDDNILANIDSKTEMMKGEISSIRKQISNDYKEREAFLDTFCRQATGSGGNKTDEGTAAKKRNSIATGGGHVPTSRKHTLLAALKAIDDNKSQD